VGREKRGGKRKKPELQARIKLRNSPQVSDVLNKKRIHHRRSRGEGRLTVGRKGTNPKKEATRRQIGDGGYFKKVPNSSASCLSGALQRSYLRFGEKEKNDR